MLKAVGVNIKMFRNIKQVHVHLYQTCGISVRPTQRPPARTSFSPPHDVKVVMRVCVDDSKTNTSFHGGRVCRVQDRRGTSEIKPVDGRCILNLLLKVRLQTFWGVWGGTSNIILLNCRVEETLKNENLLRACWTPLFLAPCGFFLLPKWSLVSWFQLKIQVSDQKWNLWWHLIDLTSETSADDDQVMLPEAPQKLSACTCYMHDTVQHNMNDLWSFSQIWISIMKNIFFKWRNRSRCFIYIIFMG